MMSMFTFAQIHPNTSIKYKYGVVKNGKYKFKYTFLLYLSRNTITYLSVFEHFIGLDLVHLDLVFHLGDIWTLFKQFSILPN